MYFVKRRGVFTTKGALWYGSRHMAFVSDFGFFKICLVCFWRKKLARLTAERTRRRRRSENPSRHGISWQSRSPGTGWYALPPGTVLFRLKASNDAGRFRFPSKKNLEANSRDPSGTLRPFVVKSHMVQATWFPRVPEGSEEPSK